MAREDGSYKHRRTIGILQLKIYGNPSGTNYYIECLLHYLAEKHAQPDEAEVCLVRMDLANGNIKVAIAVEDFLATASTPAAIDKFYNTMNARYKIKRFEKPKIYRGWHFHHGEDGRIALSQSLLIDKKLQDSGMVKCKGKHTPYPHKVDYHPPT